MQLLAKTSGRGRRGRRVRHRPPDPSGYGRLRFDGDALVELVEERHADEELKRRGLCNAGIMAIDAARLGTLLDSLELKQPKGEYYLTDIVEHACRRGWACTAIEGPWEEGHGVNAQHQLAEAEAAMQRRLRLAAMERGVIMPAPETVHLAADTELAPGVEVQPYVVFGPKVRVAEGAVIKSFSHLEGADIGAGARSDPMPGCVPAAPSAQRRGSAISSRPRTRCWHRAPRPITSPISATPISVRRAISAPARSPAIMTASASTAPRSVPACSWDRTPLWSPR
ncbi:MAG: hypothetical protein HC871_16050 [Rhizobiales bacterium]|nr:hypothetical protein [Hyphomicrobiales bacterium]